MNVMEDFRRRYQALESRERRFLLAGAIAVVLGIVFFGAIQPLHDYRERMQSRVSSAREQVAWMRGAVEALRERGPARPAVDRSGSLLAVADSSARAAGLAQSLRRIQQEGDDGVRVRLEGASFDSVLVWLENIEQRYGITVSEISLDRAEGAGLVNASLTLTRAAS